MGYSDILTLQTLNGILAKHLLIVDHKVKDEFLHQVLLPMETMDWYKINEISSDEE